MQISDKGIKLLKQFEGVVPFAYLCQANRLTIGVGHLCRDGDFYLFGRRVQDLTIQILQNQKEFKKGYIIKDGKKIFFRVRSSAHLKYTTEITDYQMDLLLQKDLERVVDCVNNIGKILTQNQFDALVCLCYNIGETAFKKSELVRKLKLGNLQLQEDFMDWDKIRGKTNSDLSKRREKEWELFDKSVDK